MVDEPDERPASKPTRAKERYAAREGRLLTGKNSRPEVRGYHNRGDPWTEQRYFGD